MSKKQSRRKVRKEFHEDYEAAVLQFPPKPRGKAKPPVEPKNALQRQYISSILHNRITFGIGPAGVGKTYLAARIAAQLMRSKEIEKIYLTRPAVESGRSIGFLKGDLDEKMQPYMAAFGQGFKDGFGEGHFDYLLRVDGKIEIVPLNFMQGRSFDEPSIILFDEAQNATVMETKMALTRMGRGSRMVITGDPRQIMLPCNVKSGLIDGLNRLRYVKRIGAVEFDREHVVRDPIVQEILDAYETDGQSIEEGQIELPGFITGEQPEH